MVTVELTSLDVLVLKKLALINQALGLQLSDKRAAIEQLALVQALTDIIRRAEPSPEGEGKTS